MPKDDATTGYTGYTLDELDQFGTLDTLPYSLDSEVWKRRPALVPGTSRLVPIVKPLGSDSE